jgi:TldD protein
MIEQLISYFEIKNSSKYTGETFSWNAVQGGHNRLIKDKRELYFKIIDISKCPKLESIYEEINLQKKEVEKNVRIFFYNSIESIKDINKWNNSNSNITLHIDMINKILICNGIIKKYNCVNYYIYGLISVKEGSQQVFMLDCQDNLKNLNFKLEINQKIDSVIKINRLPLVKPKSGNYNIILDYSVSGLFAHELIGHLSEQDLKEDFYGWVNGRKISEKNLTVINDPTIPNFVGSYLFDDEGIKSKPTKLVSNGIIVGELNNLTHNHTSLNGNARTTCYDKSPLVRMGNTYIESGNTPENKIFNSLISGIILHDPIGGGIDYKTHNCIIRSNGLLINEGNVIGKINDLLIYENIYSLLNKIDNIGNKVLWTSGCWCKKRNQAPIPVKYGGPILNLNDINIIIK